MNLKFFLSLIRLLHEIVFFSYTLPNQECGKIICIVVQSVSRETAEWQEMARKEKNYVNYAESSHFSMVRYFMYLFFLVHTYIQRILCSTSKRQIQYHFLYFKGAIAYLTNRLAFFGKLYYPYRHIYVHIHTEILHYSPPQFRSFTPKPPVLAPWLRSK